MAKLYVVGIGPGSYEEMSLRALNALKDCELIVGYSLYIDLLRPHFPDKNYYDTPMTGEVARCRYALQQAAEGIKTALVCSGDAGIYGMAGLALELRGEETAPDIEVISGLTAACTGAALLGAPLTNDFAVISLSDLLTPWETISARLKALAQADICLVMYNPASKKRRDHQKNACDILLQYQSPDTPCGITRMIARAGQGVELMSLQALREYEADMFTTIFIGNSQTKVIGGRLVTPRGYHHV